jgi:hypothetical protein
MDFELANVHTVFNKKLAQVGRKELEQILAWLKRAEQREERNAFAVGDFNANPAGQRSHFKQLLPLETSDPLVLMYGPLRGGEAAQRTTVPEKEPDSVDPEFPVYDHVLATPASQKLLSSDPLTFESRMLGVWAFDKSTAWLGLRCTQKCRRSSVSDHRPIWFALDYLAQDRD